MKSRRSAALAALRRPGALLAPPADNVVLGAGMCTADERHLVVAAIAIHDGHLASRLP